MYANLFQHSDDAAGSARRADKVNGDVDSAGAGTSRPHHDVLLVNWFEHFIEKLIPETSKLANTKRMSFTSLAHALILKLKIMLLYCTREKLENTTLF